MHLPEWLQYTLGEIAAEVGRVVDGLDPEGLAFRPDAQANTIAWLCWHIGRVIDTQAMPLGEREQIWDTEGWAQRFGLPDGYRDSGYGHSPEQVAQIAPSDPKVLVAYCDRVVAATGPLLDALTPEDFDRVIDRRWDPPVTVGVRLSSIVGDALQHVGQAAYVRGLYERRE